MEHVCDHGRRSRLQWPQRLTNLALMQRRTKRGSDRTPLEGDYDVLICGASFAGLAVARELGGSGARVLMIDRYEVGERQTWACGIPTQWLEALDLMAAHRQTFPELVVHTPHGTTRLDLPFTFSTFDYPTLCHELFEQSDCDFETAKVDGRTGDTVHTDRGDLTAPLIVDALGLAPDAGLELPAARRPALPRPRGAPARPRRGPRDLGRPQVRPRRLRLVASRRGTSCGSASAPSTRASTSRTTP